MTLTTSVFIATSLDGFIAREDGSIDWLMEANATLPPGEDCGYADFMENVDVLVMGRNTFDQVATFEPWPYSGKRVVVLSSREVQPKRDPEMHLEASLESPRALFDRLGHEGCRHAYVDGGKLIQSCLSEGLIDEMTITTIPVLIGKGRPLFGFLPHDTRLQLVRTRSYDCGFVQSTYRVQTHNTTPARGIT